MSKPRITRTAIAVSAGMAQAASCEVGNGVTHIGVQLFALQAYPAGDFEYSWRQLYCSGGQVQTIVSTTLQGSYPDEAIAQARQLGSSCVLLRGWMLDVTKTSHASV